jgi:hypothetical protein
MSTEYIIHRSFDGSTIELHEHSSLVDLALWNEHGALSLCRNLNDKELRRMIIRMVEVLSYISGDGEKELKRFNVNYGDVD